MGSTTTNSHEAMSRRLPEATASIDTHKKISASQIWTDRRRSQRTQKKIATVGRIRHGSLAWKGVSDHTGRRLLRVLGQVRAERRADAAGVFGINMLSL